MNVAFYLLGVARFFSQQFPFLSVVLINAFAGRDLLLLWHFCLFVLFLLYSFPFHFGIQNLFIECPFIDQKIRKKKMAVTWFYYLVSGCHGLVFECSNL